MEMEKEKINLDERKRKKILTVRLTDYCDELIPHIS